MPLRRKASTTRVGRKRRRAKSEGSTTDHQTIPRLHPQTLTYKQLGFLNYKRRGLWRHKEREHVLLQKEGALNEFEIAGLHCNSSLRWY